MNMNKILPRIGAAIVTITIFLFAIFLIIDFSFGSYFVCMFLSIGYIMMVAGFKYEYADDRRVAANIGMVLASIYAVLIFLVYFAQTTSVRLDELNEQSSAILDFKRSGLIFNYDLLGYGIMALSTFFTGLSIKADRTSDKWLKCLMIIHGIFFISCFFMPMTGVFSNTSIGESSSGGVIALVFWCVYFLPIGVLSYFLFGEAK